MKISWGTGIVIAFISFIAFILFFVVRMTIDSKANHDLVTPNYYERELHFEAELAAQTRAKNMKIPVKISVQSAGIVILFPEPYERLSEPSMLNGTITLSKPDNKKLDHELPLRLQENSQLIPAENLVEGQWNMVLNWTFQEKNYRIERGLRVIK
tara:strand:- start:8 stop:472 length:465 start_codon:yes stop_codon:yes gene_type:complete